MTARTIGWHATRGNRHCVTVTEAATISPLETLLRALQNQANSPTTGALQSAMAPQATLSFGDAPGLFGSLYPAAFLGGIF